MLENLGVETLAIKFDLKMRLFKSSTGLGRLWLISVVRKYSIAKLGSLPACLALIRVLLGRCPWFNGYRRRKWTR